jgi:hypothetical protein
MDRFLNIATIVGVIRNHFTKKRGIAFAGKHIVKMKNNVFYYKAESVNSGATELR